eukprot:CAMPEP_0117489716 /NCGR_PEP_ID=MMETSP0784-20121206/17180_1 /TAXON_ID=39447 /ORGANISM="" /LENGTH=339 /DNA_ID=CAMNT_0005284455 /DNA_START=165 /DNA_END=1180 /DNA_ORIENTATION=+
MFVPMLDDDARELTGPAVAHAPKGRGPAFAAVSIVAISTVAATQLTRSAQAGLHAPFFVMYVHIALATFCWPLGALVLRCTKGFDTVPCALLAVAAAPCDVALMLPLWAASNYNYVAALSFAPAGFVQTLFGTAPAIVVALSRALLSEGMTLSRVLAVIMAFSGTAAVGSRGWSGSMAGGRLLVGGALALVAVLAAAFYKVLFKFRLGEPPVSVVLGFVGTLGAAASCTGLPIALALGSSGLEDRWWSGSTDVRWGLIFASAAVDVVYNTSVACGLALGSPALIALGVILGIPANLTIDVLVNGSRVSPAEGVGAVLIIGSFAILALERSAASQSSTRR